jgi:uncharacterized DUF497 family protein
MIFEWDEDKEIANTTKHKIDFEEAKTLFNDPLLLTFPDADHSEDEMRFINIGLSTKGRVLVLIHTERGNSTRIISCRKATKNERRFYEQTSFIK